MNTISEQMERSTQRVVMSIVDLCTYAIGALLLGAGVILFVAFRAGAGYGILPGVARKRRDIVMDSKRQVGSLMSVMERATRK